MKEDGELSRIIREAIESYFEGFELVELLDVSVEEVIDAYYDKVLTLLPEILEEMGINEERDNDEQED